MIYVSKIYTQFIILIRTMTFNNTYTSTKLLGKRFTFHEFNPKNTKILINQPVAVNLLSVVGVLFNRIFHSLHGGSHSLMGGSVSLIGGKASLTGEFSSLIGGSHSLIGVKDSLMGGNASLTGGFSSLIGGSSSLTEAILPLQSGNDFLNRSNQILSRKFCFGSNLSHSISGMRYIINQINY